MTNLELIRRQREKRASVLSKYSSIEKAVNSGELEQFNDLTLSETVLLGLYNQRVRKYIGVFGHGSTDFGEVLRVYEHAGLVEVFNVRNEIEASHAAALLKWQYGETPAVFTSIGPGSMQALAGSLTPLANGLGVYYIFGDETTHNEGPNFQQIPKREEELLLKLTSVMGKSYSLHTPEAVFTALKWGFIRTHSKNREEPFYLLLPMNTQGKTIKNCNLFELPAFVELPGEVSAEESTFTKAVELILKYSKITVKTGGGAKGVQSSLMEEFLNLTDAAFVHSPTTVGIISGNNERNMTVGGSKGSISGNYAMEHCELLIVIGARGVCQWDSSGTAWKNVKQIININTRIEDALQYNRTLPILGDAGAVIKRLIKELKKSGVNRSETDKPSGKSEWLQTCMAKRKEWENYKLEIYKRGNIYDAKRNREILTQPAAIKITVDFADSVGAYKIFDAGDVQANGFQIVEDTEGIKTYTDGGASYMGFAPSAVLASAFADRGKYTVAFTGDGSFMMNPQVLLDTSYYKLHAMIVAFDNRRMSAISALQEAQCGYDFNTDDDVAVDYIKIADAFPGVKGFFGGYSVSELKEALKKGYKAKGLSIIHVPVYYGKDEAGGLGVYGSWNVGNWCDEVQKEKHRLGF